MGVNLRELVAASLQSSHLESSDIREVAIDRVGAMGFAGDPLGGELWRLRFANQADAYDRALALLTKRAKALVPSAPLRRRLCRTVLREWLDEHCRTCGGIGTIAATAIAIKHVCPTCGGSRLRRYTDQWRARAMGMDVATYLKWESRFAAVHQMVSDADRRTFNDVARQLEHIVPRGGARVLAFYRERARLRGSGGPANTESNRPGSIASSLNGA